MHKLFLALVAAIFVSAAVAEDNTTTPPISGHPPWFEDAYSNHRKLLENKAGISIVLQNRRLPLHMPLKSYGHFPIPHLRRPANVETLPQVRPSIFI